MKILLRIGICALVASAIGIAGGTLNGFPPVAIIALCGVAAFFLSGLRLGGQRDNMEA